MSERHPSDEVLQQYVLNPVACTPEEIGHIGSCRGCQDSVAAYQLLAQALKEQPAPAFDFDLAATVIGKLEAGSQFTQLQAPPRQKWQKGSVLTAVLIILAIVIPGWLFRRSAYFVFTDMSAVFNWIVFIVAGLVVGLFLLRLHKKYQDVINLIN